MGYNALKDERMILSKAEKVYNILDDLSDDMSEMFAIAQVVSTLLQMRATREQQQSEAASVTKQ